MQFLHLNAGISCPGAERHREPLIAVVEVVRAAQPLHECPVLVLGEYPRQRDRRLQIVG